MDQDLFFTINQTWTGPLLDRAMVTLSSFALWKPFLLLVIGAGLAWGGFRFRAFLGVAVPVLLLLGCVIDPCAKAWFNKPRPWQVRRARVVNLQPAALQFLTFAKPLWIRFSTPQPPPISGRSFPSGHTMSNFALAALGILFFRRWGWLYSLVAVGVAYSRVYTGAHWPLDVTLSALIGYGFGFLGGFVLERLWRWGGARWWPEFFAKHPSLYRA